MNTSRIWTFGILTAAISLVGCAVENTPSKRGATGTATSEGSGEQMQLTPMGATTSMPSIPAVPPAPATATMPQLPPAPPPAPATANIQPLPGLQAVPGTSMLSKPDCIEHLREYIAEVERLTKLVAAEPPRSDGRLTDLELQLWKARGRLEDCRYERTNYNPGYSDAGTVMPRSLAETCRIVNGTRVCNMIWLDDDKPYVCRHFAVNFDDEMQRRGVPCTINTYSVAIRAGHAINIIQIASSDPTKDRFCLVEPNGNVIGDCWYMPKGQGPGYPPADAYAPGRMVQPCLGTFSCSATPDQPNNHVMFDIGNSETQILIRLGIDTAAERQKCQEAATVGRTYCKHMYDGTIILIPWGLKPCMDEVEKDYQICLDKISPAAK